MKREFIWIFIELILKYAVSWLENVEDEDFIKFMDKLIDPIEVFVNKRAPDKIKDELTNGINELRDKLNIPDLPDEE